MSYDNYFSDSDKPYCENLNDGLLLLDAFDVQVPVKMPGMFSNGEFNSTLNVNRKCGVSIITLKSVGSGVTVGTNTITGTGEIVFRIYPNFNGFYKWNKINLDKTGTVEIGFKKTDGTVISATVASDGTISENVALKTLQEVDLVLTLSSATISGVNIEFVNNHNNLNRVGALLDAEQLSNVHSSIVSGDTGVVSGDAVYNAINNGVSGKEDKSNKVSTLDSNSNHYPSCPAVNSGLSLKEDVSNKVTSLDNSDDHYPSSKAVKTVTDTKENTSNKVTTLDSNSSHYPSCTAVNSGLSLKEDVSNKVTSLNSSDTSYPSSNAVKTVTDAKEDVSNKVTSLDSSDSHYPSSKAVKTVTDAKVNSSSVVSVLDTDGNHIPSCNAFTPFLEMLQSLVTVEVSKAADDKILIKSNVPNLLFRITKDGRVVEGTTSELEETVSLPFTTLNCMVVVKFPTTLKVLVQQVFLL